MSGYDWTKMRHLVLTVDRDWSSPQEAYKFYRRRLRRVMQEIRRELVRRGVVLLDFMTALEWHVGGWAHWHILLHMDRSDRAAMLPLDVIHRVWKHEDREPWIKALRVKNLAHWKELVGYIEGGGYFEDNGKDHQLEAPEWVRSLVMGTIRKFNGAHLGGSRVVVRAEAGETRPLRRLYAVGLDACGMGSRLLGAGEFTQVELPRHEVLNLLPELVAAGIVRVDHPPGARSWEVWITFRGRGEELAELMKQRYISKYGGLPPCNREMKNIYDCMRWGAS